MSSSSKIAIGVFTPEIAKEIKRRVLGNDRVSSRLPEHKEKFKLGWHYVYLKEDLPAASNPLTGYTQADAAICMYVEGQDTLNMEEITTVATRITITNRSTTAYNSGDFILVRWNRREWMPIWASSTAAFRHGIVTASLGCGYYTIELALWTGDMDRAGSGLGSDSASGIDTNCDICLDMASSGGSGNDSCGITLSYPPLQVTGTGDSVTAYHRASALVPLVVGSACYLTGSGTDNPSASTSSGSPPSIWQIVDGLQEHTVEYREEWSCCDGVDETGIETLLTRTPIIFAAKVCDPIVCGTCAVPSSV